MSSEIFRRLDELTARLCGNVKTGVFSTGETAAYAAGLELAEKHAVILLKNLFVDTADSAGLAKFLSFTGENPGTSDEETRRNILNAVQRKKEFFKKPDFDKYILSLNRSAYTVKGNEIRVRLNTEFGIMSFKGVSTLIKEYIPFMCALTLMGNGRTFSEWNSLQMTWQTLDGFELPFYVINKF